MDLVRWPSQTAHPYGPFHLGSVHHKSLLLLLQEGIYRENITITTLKPLTETQHIHHIKWWLWGLGFSCIFFSAQKMFSALSKRPLYFVIFRIYHSWLRIFFPCGKFSKAAKEVQATTLKIATTLCWITTSKESKALTHASGFLILQTQLGPAWISNVSTAFVLAGFPPRWEAKGNTT